MYSTDFIRVVAEDKVSISIRYVNCNHIRQIFERDGKIIIELSEYDTIVTTECSLDVFMDRFIKV